MDFCAIARASALLVMLGGLACGGEFVSRDRGGGDGGPVADTGGSPDYPERLTIDPPNQTIFIDTSVPSTPATQAYTAKFGGQDVTSSAVFSIDQTALGSFAGPLFTSVTSLPGSALGVTALVSADYQGQHASAKLTIVQLRKTPDSDGKRDFYFVSPYQKDPTPDHDVLKFSTNIQKADVAFVMDTTGSMQGAIDNLKNSLSSSIIPALSAKIPSVGLAVVDFRDWGDASTSWVFKVRQVITTDPVKAQTAVNQMAAGGGGDEPECHLAAMHYTLTGAANQTIPAHTPAAGTTGGVDFRPGAVPVVVLISDSNWHDPSGAVGTAAVKTAFQNANARFVSIYRPMAGTNYSATTNCADLSDASGSAIVPSAFGGKCGTNMCCTGVNGAGQAPDGPGGKCRLNFKANGDGTGVSDSAVTAIQVIAVGSTYDITAVLSNDPANPDGIDATKLVKALRAMDEGDATEGCPPHEAYDSNGDSVKDTFKEVTVGTPICFEVLPAVNNTVPAKDDAQFVKAFINMVGNPGAVDLGDRREIIFLIPPKDVIVN